MKGLIFGTVLGPLLRHGAGAGGAWLVAQGLADESTSQQVSGALMTLGAFGVSLIEKRWRW